MSNAMIISRRSVPRLEACFIGTAAVFACCGLTDAIAGSVTIPPACCPVSVGGSGGFVSWRPPPPPPPRSGPALTISIRGCALLQIDLPVCLLAIRWGVVGSGRRYGSGCTSGHGVLRVGQGCRCAHWCHVIFLVCRYRDDLFRAPRGFEFK